MSAAALKPQTLRTAARILLFTLAVVPAALLSANGTQTHDFWEEVYILEGAIYDTVLKKNFTSGMYACRPPGMKHGPWISKEGCTTFEVRYLFSSHRP